LLCHVRFGSVLPGSPYPTPSLQWGPGLAGQRTKQLGFRDWLSLRFIRALVRRRFLGERPGISDWVLSLALVSMPFWGFLLVRFSIGVYQTRFFILTIFGFCLLLPLLLFRPLQLSPRAPVCIAGWLALAGLWNALEVKLTMREISSVTQGQGE